MNGPLARVIPLHKNGPRNLFDNYLPISILPVIGKVFGKKAYTNNYITKLYDQFVPNNLLYPIVNLAFASFIPQLLLFLIALMNGLLIWTVVKLTLQYFRTYEKFLTL